MVHVFCKEGILVEDIPADYILIVDSQEIEEIKKYLGSPSWFDYGCIFVKVIEGDYHPVMYGLYWCIPRDHHKTDMIYMVHSTADPLCPECMRG